MRTYGRVYGPPDAQGNQTPGPWQVVTTDTGGDNTLVYLTTLLQCLRLNLGEAPFYSQYGIPARTSILQQIAPDYNASLTQKQFAQYFASLAISRASPPAGVLPLTPTYDVSVTALNGASLPAQIPG